jgi:DNA-binding transcriptional MerR regulator
MRTAYTIKDLSEKIGVSPKTVRFWLAGDHLPALKTSGNTVVFDEDDLATIQAVFSRYGHAGMKIGLARKAAEVA